MSKDIVTVLINEGTTEPNDEFNLIQYKKNFRILKILAIIVIVYAIIGVISFS